MMTSYFPNKVKSDTLITVDYFSETIALQRVSCKRRTGWWMVKKIRMEKKLIFFFQIYNTKVKPNISINKEKRNGKRLLKFENN